MNDFMFNGAEMFCSRADDTGTCADTATSSLLTAVSNENNTIVMICTTCVASSAMPFNKLLGVKFCV